MAEQDDTKPEGEKTVGDAPGGGEAGGSGNILAGVQPDADTEDQEDERRDDD